jgi:hypothetical protein
MQKTLIRTLAVTAIVLLLTVFQVARAQAAPSGQAGGGRRVASPNAKAAPSATSKLAPIRNALLRSAARVGLFPARVALRVTAEAGQRAGTLAGRILLINLITPRGPSVFGESIKGFVFETVRHGGLVAMATMELADTGVDGIDTLTRP